MMRVKWMNSAGVQHTSIYFDSPAEMVAAFERDIPRLPDASFGRDEWKEAFALIREYADPTSFQALSLIK